MSNLLSTNNDSNGSADTNSQINRGAISSFGIICQQSKSRHADISSMIKTRIMVFQRKSPADAEKNLTDKINLECGNVLRALATDSEAAVTAEYFVWLVDLSLWESMLCGQDSIGPRQEREQFKSLHPMPSKHPSCDEASSPEYDLVLDTRDKWMPSCENSTKSSKAAMATIPDIRDKIIEYPYDEVRLHMIKQWPSDPLYPSADNQATAGLDCLCILYRIFISYIRPEAWPSRQSSEAGAADLRYFMADFDEMKASTNGVEWITNARADALKVLQRGANLPGRGSNGHSFADLHNTPRFYNLIWEQYWALFYKPAAIWDPQRSAWHFDHKLIPLAIRARCNNRVWNTDAHSSLQKHIDASLELKEKDASGRYFWMTFNGPTFVEVDFCMPVGWNLSLKDLFGFHTKYLEQSEDTDPTEVQTKLSSMDCERHNCYGLVAAVRLRHPQQGIATDSIRLWDVDGGEIQPYHCARAGTVQRDTWGFKISETIPAGQRFSLFYVKRTLHPYPVRNPRDMVIRPHVPILWRMMGEALGIHNRRQGGYEDVEEIKEGGITDVRQVG